MNKKHFPSKFFITGTDTNVGKTLVSALLLLGLQGVYWKPIHCGTQEPSDSEWVKAVTKMPSNHFLSEKYVFKAPVSPHLASQMEGVEIDLDTFSLPPSCSTFPLIVEGCGGLMVPLNSSFYISDLIKKIDLPVIVVSRSTLGTINHTLLTLTQLRNKGVSIFGVIMNGPKNLHNRLAIEQYGNVPVIAEIEPLPVITKELLLQTFEKSFS